MEAVPNHIIDAPPKLKEFLAARARGASADEMKRLRAEAIEEARLQARPKRHVRLVSSNNDPETA
jgi:hypothetical protein